MRGCSRGGGGRVSHCAGLWGHSDAGGGQTEHPGGGQVRGCLTDNIPGWSLVPKSTQLLELVPFMIQWTLVNPNPVNLNPR